jgi:hypothetical protein
VGDLGEEGREAQTFWVVLRHDGVDVEEIVSDFSVDLLFEVKVEIAHDAAFDVLFFDKGFSAAFERSQLLLRWLVLGGTVEGSVGGRGRGASGGLGRQFLALVLDGFRRGVLLHFVQNLII